ncbi:hypothetical protein C8J56DRAFT_1109108 [Mycena floridula]|nr:hypothetical protein C8J56DRAFT_1109108 [Mycena floridula]
MTWLRDLLLVLGNYLPRELTIPRALSIIATLASIYPLLRLHTNQRREPSQPARTAWLISISELIKTSFKRNETPDDIWLDEENRGPAKFTDDLCRDLPIILELLGLKDDSPEAGDLSQSFFPRPRIILCTTHLDCLFCINTDRLHTLRRREKPQIVRVLAKDLTWVEADLFIAHCVSCKADYYPDKVTFIDEGNRIQKLEYETEYYRVSKHKIWVHHRVAVLQEKALLRFHAGWSNFGDWLNDILQIIPKITNRQSRRLFLEHFSRRLLQAHHLDENFTCSSNPSTAELAEYVRAVIGRDGGTLASSMDHGCLECTRWKRYPADLVAEGLVVDTEAVGVVDIPAEAIPEVDTNLADIAGPNVLPQIPGQQVPPEPGEPRGYIRQAVMDGKTIGHRKCALDICNKELVNYKNGRFCQEHLALANICGIIPCGRPVHICGALTCDDPAHKAWYKQYAARFSRLSFPGVQRVIRRQQNLPNHDPAVGRPPAPRLQINANLPALGDLAGDKVVHTFRAKSVYCLQTVQWACGVPIGWGKCYMSESSPQVLSIIEHIWQNHPDSRPSFLVYDDACDLLRHIVTQNPRHAWLASTKFIVDAWHYIGHQATDVLCRVWCNPAPTNGSQPDLVLAKRDATGVVHSTRAFNTETAEQFNSWLNRFEPQLRQMTAANFDFFVHVLFLLYKELSEARIAKKGHELTEEFWDIVNGLVQPAAI